MNNFGNLKVFVVSYHHVLHLMIYIAALSLLCDQSVGVRFQKVHHILIGFLIFFQNQLSNFCNLSSKLCRNRLANLRAHLRPVSLKHVGVWKRLQPCALPVCQHASLPFVVVAPRSPSAVCKNRKCRP